LVAVVLISRYQRPLQKIETIRTSLLRPIRSHKTAHTDRVFVVVQGASVGSFLSLLYMSLTTHADPYEATHTHSLSLSHSLSHVGHGEVTGHNSHVIVVDRWPAWSPSRGNEGGRHERLHGRHGRLLPPAQRPSSRASYRAAAGSCPRATRGSPTAQRRWSSTWSRWMCGPCHSWARTNTWHRRSSAARATAAPLTGGRCNGSTPFKGDGNRAMLCNIIEQPL
jgi:hypothetical protein